MSANGKLILASLAALGLTFALLFGESLVAFSPQSVVPGRALEWEPARAATALTRWAPAALLLAFALVLGTARGEAAELVKGAAAPAALLAALLSIAGLLGGPALSEKTASLEAEGRAFNALMTEARAAIRDGEPATARARFRGLQAIDRDDPRVAALEKELVGAELREGRAAADEAARKARALPAPPPPPPGGGRELFLKAQGFYDRGDWYSAHWYAKEAERLDPSLPEAARLAARAWEKLASAASSAADKETAAFFARKYEAYSRLRSSDFIGAFELFSALASERAGDPDVKRYLEESRKGLESIAFFLDEYSQAARKRRLPRFLALVAGPGGKRGVLAAREASFAGEAAYFLDLEYRELPADGAPPTLAVAAPYAKLQGGRIFFTAVDRAEPSIVHRGRALLPGGAEKEAEALRLDLEPAEARALALARQAPAGLSVLDAVGLAGKAGAHGLDPRPIILDLARRLGLPFGLFLAAMLGALVGLRFRAPGAGPGAGAWFALPLMAAAATGVWYLVDGADLASTRWAVALFPGTRALLVSAGLRAAFLVAAVLLTATLRGAEADEEG